MTLISKYLSCSKPICKSAAIIFLSALTVFPATAQESSASFSDPLAVGFIYRASQMLRTGNSLGALNQSDAAAVDVDALSPDKKAECLANEGGALFERHDPQCLVVLNRLAREFPTSPLATQAVLTMGDWYWYLARWHDALKLYGKVDVDKLCSCQRSLYTYRIAFSYLNCGLKEKAQPLFEKLTKDDAFSRAADFYLAYIDYLNGDYDTAYDKMSALAADDADSSPAVSSSAQSGRIGRISSRRQPDLALSNRNYVSDGIEPLYYMTQIEYLRGQFDDVINHASTLLAKRPVADLLPELHRLAGLSYFKKGDLAAARGHLEYFVDSTESPNDDAIYALAATEYADGDLDKARQRFRSLTDRHNVLAQGAYLYLGQIAEHDGQRNEAAMAFNKAASMAFDSKVAESALYNYIVANSKGGNVPFASSIAMHEDFLKRFPASQYSSAVEESLASAFFHENDYSRALDAINRVKEPASSTSEIKQKILYKLGCSEVAGAQLSSAISHLREAAAMTRVDSRLAAEARLWVGEALYRAGDYSEAANAYGEALRGSLTLPNAAMARYGLAYSLFKENQWNEAQKYFAAVASDPNASADLKGDALIREADCLLYLRKFADAAVKYRTAVNQKTGDVDYAAFRHAVVVGVTDGTDRKMKELDAFLRDRQGSSWTPEVLLEAGNTMASLDRPDKAAVYFVRLNREFPQNNNSRAGSLSLAFSYLKQKDLAKAEDSFMDIIRRWPTSEEAAIANDEMRRLAASNGSLAAYARFLSEIDGAPQIDPDEMDAISFDAAETAYSENQSATAALEQYVADFPDGRFLANALMDLAEAADMAGNRAKALSCLDRLLAARGDSPQVPAALFLKAQILEDEGNRDSALEAYLALEQAGGKEFAPEATAGVMRTASDARQRTDYARRLMAMGGVDASDADDARFYEASGLLHGSDPDAGVKALQKLSACPDNISGAKAAVELGNWFLDKGDAAKALETLERFTDAGSVHSYWLARGFIALADAYHAQGNDYLASEYMKSLRDNYPGDEPDIADAVDRRIKQFSK